MDPAGRYRPAPPALQQRLREREIHRLVTSAADAERAATAALFTPAAAIAKSAAVAVVPPIKIPPATSPTGSHLPPPAPPGTFVAPDAADAAGPFAPLAAVPDSRFGHQAPQTAAWQTFFKIFQHEALIDGDFSEEAVQAFLAKPASQLMTEDLPGVSHKVLDRCVGSIRFGRPFSFAQACDWWYPVKRSLYGM
jgi:hypothetical protein